MDTAAGSTWHIFTNGPAYRQQPAEEDNAIDFSSYRQLHRRFYSGGLSIKHVLRGTELYRINGHDHYVSAGRYLLANTAAGGEVIIDSETDVLGICVELSPGILAEVAATNHNPSSPYPEKDFYEFLTTSRFFENNYEATDTRVGRYLLQASPSLSVDRFADPLYAGEFFYLLAEKVIADQRELYRYCSSLKLVKSSTQKDLLRRLLKGKELIDCCYTERLSIGEIARAATMSEYYFLRLFRQTFGTSPHRYIIDKRLQAASKLICNTGEPIADIAYTCGFTDAQAFSKTFRKKYGFSPGMVRRPVGDWELGRVAENH